MKKYLFLIALTVLFCSCEKENTSENLLGKWRLILEEEYSPEGKLENIQDVYELWAFYDGFMSMFDNPLELGGRDLDYSLDSKKNKLAIGSKQYSIQFITTAELVLKSKAVDNYTSILHFTKEGAFSKTKYPQLLLGDWKCVAANSCLSGNSTLSISSDEECVSITTYLNDGTYRIVDTWAQEGNVYEGTGNYSITDDILNMNGVYTYSETESIEMNDEYSILGLTSNYLILEKEDDILGLHYSYTMYSKRQ